MLLIHPNGPTHIEEGMTVKNHLVNSRWGLGTRRAFQIGTIASIHEPSAIISIHWHHHNPNWMPAHYNLTAREFCRWLEIGKLEVENAPIT